MATTSIVYSLVARDRASRTFAQVGRSASQLGSSASRAGAAIKKGLAVGAVATAGLGLAVLRTAGDFEKSMNRVEALSGASGAALQKLRNQAKDLGSTTQYNATQAADAMGDLATAGLTVNQIYGAMPSVLALASSEQLDLQRSAEITTAVMTGYGMTVKQIPHAVDAMVKASVKANTSVDDLGEAFKYAGPVAHTAGLQFEESTAAMALMGNAGIKASMAGTALRGAITRLLAPTKEVQGVLDTLGVKVSTASGKLLPLHTIIDELAKSGATTGQIMTIFGQRAGPAMAALIQQGSDKLVKLTGELEQSGGTADKISKTQMKGLNGTLTRLRNSWQGLLIELGDTGALTLATKAVTGVTDGVRGMTAWLNDHADGAVRAFKTTLGGMVPVGRIKADIKTATAAVADFFDGLSGKQAKKRTVNPFQAADVKAPTGVLAPVPDSTRYGQQLRKAITGGLSGIDWGQVGKALGSGLSTAIGWIGEHAADLTKKFAKVISGIDWVDVGKAVGGQAIPFAIGFINNLFAPLFSLDFWKKHWLDTILAVISVIPIGRVAGVFGKLVSKVPFLRAFAPILKGIEGLGGVVEKGLGKALKPLGRFGRSVWSGIVTGFTKVFPETAGAVGRFIDRLALGIIGYAGRFGGAAERLIGGFGRGILTAGSKIGEVIGKVIGYAVKPFANAGSWLVSKGSAVVSGLKSGIVSAAKAVGGFAKRTVIDPVVNAFSTAGSWLISRGRSTVSGFKNGIVAAAKGVGGWTKSHVIDPVTGAFKAAGSWLKSKGSALISGLKNGVVGAVKGIGSWIKSHVIDPVVNAVKKFFGIHSPSKVFAEIGGHLVAGLMQGLATTSGAAIARKVFGDMPHALGRIVKKGIVTVGQLPQKALKALSGLGGEFSGLLGVSGGAHGAQALGQAMAASNYHWQGSQWDALKALWMGESGWNYKARNASSGAYGIPQALPASKMASAGPDWRTNPGTQILWGLRYIRSRYGTPANAYAQWKARSPHWYDAGGLARGKGYLPKNTPHPERVLSPRQTAAFERLVDVLDHGAQAGGQQRPVVVHVHFDDPTLRDLIRVEVDAGLDDFSTALGAGAGST